MSAILSVTAGIANQRPPLPRAVIQIQSYRNHLLTALPPRKEPGDYATITNTSVYRAVLQTLMTNSNISENLTNEYLRSFDSQTAVLINGFSAEYTKGAFPLPQTYIVSWMLTGHNIYIASNEFIAYLEAQLAILVPHRSGDFELSADRISITKDLAKTALRSALESYGNTVLVAFDSDIRVFEITQDAGKIRVEAARRDLVVRIELHKGAKFGLLRDTVSDWNRERLNENTQPVLIGVVDHTIDSSAKLQTAIAKAKSDFWSRACGDEPDRVEVCPKTHD